MPQVHQAKEFTDFLKEANACLHQRSALKTGTNITKPRIMCRKFRVWAVAVELVRSGRIAAAAATLSVQTTRALPTRIRCRAAVRSDCRRPSAGTDLKGKSGRWVRDGSLYAAAASAEQEHGIQSPPGRGCRLGMSRGRPGRG